MDVVLKFLFISFLSVVTGQLETDYVVDVDENTRQFILEQNEVMRKFLKEEMLKVFATLFETFDQKLTGELGPLKETLQTNHRQISRLLWSLKLALNPQKTGSAQMQVEVEEINDDDEGTIEFSGGSNLNLRRKIWVLQSKGGNSDRLTTFNLEENKLGEDARLSLWGSGLANGDQHVWTGSQSDWRNEQSCGGNVILLTLTILPFAAETPSFKLSFDTFTSQDSDVYSSEIVRSEMNHIISFPPNNARDFANESLFTAVIAPLGGKSFGLTLKYLDIQGSPPNCSDNTLDVWFLDETSTGEHYKRLPSSAFTRCGMVGDISEHLGNSTVAILRFKSENEPLGKGFRVEVK